MMTEIEERDIMVLPQQARFISSKFREVLYSGSFGSGKSRSICLKCVMRASVKGAREGLARKTFNTLRRSTLKTLLEPDGALPPVLPEGTYSYNKAEQEIRIRGGGSIVLFGCDAPEKLGSLNLTGIGLDEAVEVDYETYTMLRGRIRMQVEGLSNQIYSACNPSTPSHWLCIRFGLGGGHVAAKNCEAIRTSVHDNWFLDPDYVADLETLSGVAYKRFVLGEWVGSETLVYDQWSRDFVVSKMPDSYDITWIAVDEGWNNPACLLLLSVKDERLYVRQEWYERKKLEADVVKKCQEWNSLYNPECFVVDPSSAKLRAAMRHVGLDVIEADNAVYSGIQAVQRLLNRDESGEPLLSVHDSCENTIMEFESYEWKVDKSSGDLLEIPKKNYDHALDSLRYGTVWHYGLGVRPRVRVPSDRQEKIEYAGRVDSRVWEEDHPMWS